MIHEELVRWFDHETAGPELAYQHIAERIWTAWQRGGKDEQVAHFTP